MCNPLYKSFFFRIRQDLPPFVCVCTCIASGHIISQGIIGDVVCASSVFKAFVYAILYVYDSCLYSNILIFAFFWITLIHCGRNVSSKWIDAISVVRFCGWFAYQEITLPTTYVKSNDEQFLKASLAIGCFLSRKINTLSTALALPIVLRIFLDRAILHGLH